MEGRNSNVIWLKSTFVRNLLAVAVLLSAGTAVAEIPRIIVVYPKPGQEIGAHDSTFILGHLPEELTSQAQNIVVRINGHDVNVYDGGGFIAFLPISPGDFTFDLNAYLKKDLALYKKRPSSVPLASCSLSVKVPFPLRSIRAESLAIAEELHAPSGDIVMAAGDQFDVLFQATPGCTAWFSIPGVADSVPMAEMPPREQPYWGESLFGSGITPESLIVKGLYSGFYTILSGVSCTEARITYHLTGARKSDRKVTRESSYRITLNSREYPFTVRFTDSIQVVRYGPMKGYLAIFQPKGVEALAVGAEGDWYRVRLTKNQFGWVSKSSVERLPKGIVPPISYMRSIRTYGGKDSVLIEFPLSGMHPFRVFEDDQRTLRLQLFGVNSDTDWIRYDFADSLISIATWAEPEDGLYEFRIKLTQDLWGYDCYYKGNAFYLQINRPPVNVHDIRGKTIVVDPGHSLDPGSTGPTGYTEAEANLALGLALKDVLEARGAKVVMTRSGAENLPLADRPIIAKKAHADLFVSIHNNAQPDGVNPMVNNGTSTYYYHPHSIDLAKDIQREMIATTGLNDYGLFYGNLAVDRPTQYPAVLAEVAFIILPEQEAMLKTDRFRKTVAKAITAGVEEFLKGYNGGR